MFELPEILNLSKQINETLKDKIIQSGNLGNSPHKFVWYNRSPGEFAELSFGRTIGQAYGRGRWLFVPLEPDYLLVLGELGGKILFHPEGSFSPEKYHLLVNFKDGSFLSVMTQMWGAMELYKAGEEQKRQYIHGMRPTPIDLDFSRDYFEGLLEEFIPLERRSLKGLLTQDQLIPGLGNAIAQDILFHARLHPRRPIQDLDKAQQSRLYEAILLKVAEIASQGGRYDELNLFGQPGGYIRLMDKNGLLRPCPICGGEIQKMQYLGGACYFCPHCQE